MNTDDKKDQQESAIPLLEDVVSIEEIESEFIDFSNDEAIQEDSNIPDYDEVLLSMRDDIARQLETDLTATVTDAINIAIDEAIARIGQILHDELDNTLPHRISNLIESRLEREFGPRHELTRDESIEDSIDLYRDDNL
jgi:hypothetical protein